MLLFTAYIARIASLTTQGLWRDEVDQWRYTLQSWYELWAHFDQIGWNGPLFSPLLKIWTHLTGTSVYAMRYFALVWGMLSIALAYVLARRLLDERAARLSALLMALSPYMVWYAQEIKMYTWVPMLVLLVLYALDRASAEQQWGWWPVVFIALWTLFYSHILGPLILPVITVWMLLRYGRNWHIWLVMSLLLLGLALVFRDKVQWLLQVLQQPRETGFPAYSLRQMLLILLNGWSAGIYQANLMGGHLSTYALAVFGVLALGGIGALVWQQQFRTLGMLVAWLSLPFLALWFVSLRGPIFTDRYLIWTAPAFYYLVSAGLAALREIERALAPVALSLLLLFNTLSLYAQAAYPIKPQFPQAIAHLQAKRAAGDLLLFQIPYNHHVVRYYAPDLLDPWAEAPYTNWPLGDDGYQVGPGYVDKEMRAITAGHTHVWLVYSEVGMWDARELVKAWLDAHGTLLEEKHFQGVSLYHYKLD